ncbi:MAG: CBS domain-containing protein [Promethearchaeota archaeon]
MFELTAKDIMTKEITTITATEKVSAAEITMIKHNVGGLPVITEKSKELIGIITQRDIQISKSIIGTEAFHISDIYSSNPVKVYSETPFPQIIHLMNDNNIERVPVVNDDNHVIGIIVNSDIVKALDHYFKKQNKTY